MAQATVAAQFHDHSSGASTSLPITVTVPAGSRCLIAAVAEAGSISSPFAFSGVTLGTTSAIRIFQEQAWTWKLEVWAIDVPSESDTTVTITAPSSVKMGAWVIFLDNARSLYSFSNVRSDGSSTFPFPAAETTANVTIPDTPINDTTFLLLSVIASTATSQTFTAVSPLVATAADNSVATTNVHLALGTHTQVRYASAGGFPVIADQWTLGTASIWAGLSIVVNGTSTTSAGCLPVLSNFTDGGILGSWSHAADADKTLYVMLQAGNTVPSGVTFNGVALRWVGWQREDGGNTYSLTVWSLVNPPDGNFSVVVSGATTRGFSFNIANGPADGSICGLLSNLDNAQDPANDYGVGFDTNSLVIGSIYHSAVFPPTITVTDGTQLATAVGYAVGVKQGTGGPTKIGFHDSAFTGHEKLNVLFTIPSGCDAVSGGMYQPWFGGSFYPFNGQMTLPYGGNIDVDPGIGQWQGGVMPIGGTLRNLRIDVPVAPGSGKSLTFRVIINGADSALFVTISDAATSGELTGVPVIFAKYARVTFHVTSSGGPATTAFSYWMEHESSEANVSLYGGGRRGQTVPGVVGNSAGKNVFYPKDGNWSTGALDTGLVGCAGSITGFMLEYNVFQQTLGTGTYEVACYKNGTKQDGSGGTVDTRVTLAVPVTMRWNLWDFSDAFNLPVVVGDNVRVEAKATNAGNIGGSLFFVAKFRATTNGEFNINGCGAGGTTNYFPANDNKNGDSATEANVTNKVGTHTVPLQVLGSTFLLDVAPGVGASRSIKVRKNSVDQFTVTISNTGLTNNQAGSVTYAATDTFNIKEAFTGSPAGTNQFWALRGFMDPGGLAVTGFQKATQSGAYIAYDEDAETDVIAVTGCTGGGTVGTGTNPSDGTALAGKFSPLAWIEVTTTGGTVYRWAKKGIPIGGPYKQPRVLSLGRWSMALTDRSGVMETASGDIRLGDVDGVLRALYDSGALDDAIVDYYLSDLTVLLAGGTAQQMGRAVVTDFRPETDLTFRMHVEDVLMAAGTGVLAQELRVPTLLIGPDGANIGDRNPTDAVFDKPVPWGYGSLVDVQAVHVGNWTFAEIPGNNPVFLVSYGVLKQIQRVKGADIWSSDPPTARVTWPASAYGDWLWAPGQPGWFLPNDWWEFGGRRFTPIVGRDGHPAIMAAVSGKIPIAVDACGLETVGDKTGAMINSIPRIVLHFLNNGVVQDMLTNALAIAPMPGGGVYTLFDTATWDVVHTYLASRNYVGATVLGHDLSQQPLRDTIADACLSGGFDAGQNRHGQIVAVVFDTSDAAAGALRFTDKKAGSIIAGSWRQDPKKKFVENIVRYVYGRKYVKTLADLTPATGNRLPNDPFEAAFYSGIQRKTSASSIAALGGGKRGERPSKVLELNFVDDQATADDVAERRRDLFSPPSGRAECSFDTAIYNAQAIALGQVIWVECLQASWTGYRRCQIRRIEPDFDGLVATIDVRDVDDLLLVIGDAPAVLGTQTASRAAVITAEWPSDLADPPAHEGI